MQLMRLVAPHEFNGSSAGLWLVPRLGLMLRRDPEGWRVVRTPWLTTQDHCESLELRRQRARWLHRHGLDRACFPTRRAAGQELQRALRLDPLEPQ